MTPLEHDIQIAVTWRDIWQGRALLPNACPIALAIQRTVPDATWICVGPDDVLIQRNNWSGPQHDIALPRTGRRFVALFDMLHVAWPVTFTLAVEGSRG